MKRSIVLIAFFLAACEPSHPRITFDRGAECTVTPTRDERIDRRQGHCIVWNKVGDSRFCAVYNYYSVTQTRRVVQCTRSEWHDGRAGVEQ